MTNEEASYLLANADRTDFDEFMNEALDMGIKALEQEPCEDCISRDAVLKQINCWIGSGEYKYAMSEWFLSDRIKTLPPVNPQEPKTDVLYKIRAEIIENSIEDYKYHGCGTDELIIETSEVLRILEKYTAEKK